MGYLKNKPGSIEEVIAKQTALESGYQDKFKKELEKAGKGVGAMTPKEKSAFFNKMDDKHKAKNESVDVTSQLAEAKAMITKMNEEDAYDKDDKKEKKMVVTKADKAGNTVAYQKFKAGDKRYVYKEEASKFTSQQIKQAYGIANDPRYKAGNYSGAVAAIEKLAKGLSLDPAVQNVLKRTNEDATHTMPDGTVMKGDKHKKETYLSANKKEVKEADDGDKRKGDPCWKGYKMVGMKNKGGQEVPNCVPMSNEELEEAGIELSEVKKMAESCGDCGLGDDKCKCEKENKESTMTGKKETEIDTEPKISYNK